MNIKILTPEQVVFEGEVSSVMVPGINGDFHIMKNHADVVSSLKNGAVKLYTSSLPETAQKHFSETEKGIFSYTIKGGVIEYNHNNGIILCD